MSNQEKKSFVFMKGILEREPLCISLEESLSSLFSMILNLVEILAFLSSSSTLVVCYA